MTVETKSGTTTQTFIYHDIVLNAVGAGKAADANIAGISFAIADPQLGDASGAYGKISAKNVDLVLAAKIITETRDEADAPKQALLDAIDIDGFHLGGAHGEVDVRRLTVATLTGRPPLRAWREAAAVAPTAGLAQRNALLAAFLDAFGSDGLTATDIALVFSKATNPTSLTIGAASISRLDGPRIDGVETQNLVFERASGKIGLETLSFHGVDLNPLTGADREPNLLGEGLRPDFDRIALTKLQGRLGSNVEAGAASETTFEVERFEIESAASKETARPGLSIALDHLTAPVADTGVFSTLATLGYARVDLSGRLGLDWSAASRDLAINSFSVDGADMGSVNVAAQFANVTPDLASSDEATAAAATRGVLIKKLDLHVENAGFFDKALAAQAKNEKQSVDEARQSDILRAKLLLPALLGDEPSARALGAALAKFIADPKNLSLKAVAPEGIGVADLELVETPGALLKKIDITAAANQ